MPRQYLRRLLPSAQLVREAKAVRLFGRLLHNPDLWHLNRHSVALAVAIGLATAFVPIPIGQMLLAAALAIVVGCNLPISVVVVWVSNPVTMAPLFFAAYKLGAWLLDEAPRAVQFEISFAWLMNKLGAIWQPFLLGCAVLALASALLGYVTVQLIWRIHVMQRWRERRARREALARRGEHADGGPGASGKTTCRAPDEAAAHGRPERMESSR